MDGQSLTWGIERERIKRRRRKKKKSLNRLRRLKKFPTVLRRIESRKSMDWRDVKITTRSWIALKKTRRDYKEEKRKKRKKEIQNRFTDDDKFQEIWKRNT